MTNREWLLVGQAKNGDTHAFALLYETYYKDLYYFALSYLGNEAAAEDAVSAGVLKAYEKLPMLKRNDSFKAWIFKIVANACMDSFRERKHIIPLDFENTACFLEQGEKESGYEQPEWEDALSELTEKERLVITMTVFSDYTSTETAKALGMRAGTVRSLKSRGLEKLKKLLA